MQYKDSIGPDESPTGYCLEWQPPVEGPPASGGAADIGGPYRGLVCKEFLTPNINALAGGMSVKRFIKIVSPQLEHLHIFPLRVGTCLESKPLAGALGIGSSGKVAPSSGTTRRGSSRTKLPGTGRNTSAGVRLVGKCSLRQGDPSLAKAPPISAPAIAMVPLPRARLKRILGPQQGRPYRGLFGKAAPGRGAIESKGAPTGAHKGRILDPQYRRPYRWLVC